ncbi:BTB/POZ domain-containing protein KCTD7-like [Crassostrea angulata]|uniref:BTB/POZ domain-containing protein KCTD7-like n=1 Tax=Magallana angulata TaxID=2784310 RepID=UPI0022B14F4B|nr:BTB/POZ domain-containing protein KCTD7-like [Crassostrea angulata]
MSLKIPVPKSSGDSLTPKDPASASSTVSPDTSTSAALPVQSATPKASEIPLSDLNKDLALSESDKDSIYSKTTLVSKRSNPDQLSIHTDGVIDPEPEQEYAVPDLPSSTPYIPTNKLSLKVKDIITKQDEVVTLNIGGTIFTTTRSTLREDPSLLLATLSSKLPSTPFFIDRNPKHFLFTLVFLRNSCCVSSISIPTSATALKELSQECAFYEIGVLSRLIEPMLKLFSHQ